MSRRARLLATLATLALATAACGHLASPEPMARTAGGPAVGARRVPAREYATPRSTDSGSPAPTGANPPVARTGGEQFPVADLVRNFDDQSRGRQLRTVVYFPVSSTGTAAPGPFPLVLMAHGYRLVPRTYEGLLRRVASAGYVVASPAFPHTNGDTGDGDRSDIVNQPADLSFVTNAVIELSATQVGVLPKIADPAHIGAMGHSDGGLTVTAWAYNSTYRDRRVTAAVTMSGGIGLFGGSYFTEDSPPLLGIHATGDASNPFGATTGMLAAVPPGTPKYLFRIEGGSHQGPYDGEATPAGVGQVIVDFLDAHLAGDAPSHERLLRENDYPGMRLTSLPD